MDVVYDHFLANDPNEFNEDSLLKFSQEVYNMVGMYEPLLPDHFAKMFPYMKSQNWLFNYHTRWGIERSMGGLVRRAAYLTESRTAFILFEEHFQLLQDCYRQFWADMKPFARKRFDELLSGDPA